MSNEERNIPPHTEGGKTDTSHKVEFDSAEQAKRHFLICKNRLLDVSRWHSLSGEGTAEFQLADSSGTPVDRLAQVGDFFKINIPAPGTVSGDGNDWVQIENIDEQLDSDNNEYIAILVRPASNPNTSKNNTSHFFNETATSTFLVKRNGTVVSAEVHGRNEKPNLETENVIDKIRNTVIAIGAILGLSDAQWKSLVRGLLKDSHVG